MPLIRSNPFDLVSEEGLGSKLQDVHIMAQVCRVDLAHQEFAEELVLWSLQACPGLATMTLPFTTR